MTDISPGRRFLPLALVGTIVALVCAASAFSSSSAGRYSDPNGDSRTAPDITNVGVASDPGGQILFTIEIADVPPRSAVLTFLLLNTDMNEATGEPDTLGADYFFYVDEAERAFGFASWNGADWNWDAPADTVRISGGRDGYSISVNRSELGNTAVLNFWVRTLRGNDVDDAPDEGTWNYSLTAGGPEIREVLVATSPAAGPRAGRPFAVTPMGLTLPPSGAALNIPPKPESYSCRATLAGKALRGGGTGSCSWRLPEGARGKRLIIVLTVSYQGSSKSVRFVYRVRR